MGYRRRNPTAKWGDAFMSTLLGLVTGAVAYGVNFGVEYIPVAPLWRTVIFGSAGTVGSLGLAKWGNERLGAGFGGGVGALLMGRVVTQIRMHQVAPAAAPSTAGASGMHSMHGRGAGRVYTRDAGAVYSRDAGAVYQRDAGGLATMRRPVFGPSFKDAGASRMIPGPVRFFGPHSWAYDAGRVGRPTTYVSAHNLPR